MPRALTFDPEEKLDLAMKLFWERGFEATSMQALVDAMGINRFSIYNSFGDKRALYHAALERYMQRYFDRCLEPLMVADASLAAVRAYLETVERALYRTLANGCFLQNAALEMSKVDKQVAGFSGDRYTRLAGLLEAALLRAAERGELKRQTDPRACARFLLASVQGLVFLRKTSTDKDLPRENLRFLIDELETW